MARIRSIKPSFFIDEELAEHPPITRLLYIGLWTLADVEGRLDDRPRRIQVQVLPFDDCDADALLDELARTGHIVRYEIDGKRYIEIPTFAEHQNPHIGEKKAHQERKSRGATIPAPCESGASTVQAPCKNSASTIQAGRILDPGSLILDQDPDQGGGKPADAAPLLESWNALAKEHGLPTVREVGKSTRAKAVKARLSDPKWRAAYPDALAKIATTPFLLGENKRGWRIDFDFFIKPDSVTRILEGKYANGKAAVADLACKPERSAFDD